VVFSCSSFRLFLLPVVARPFRQKSPGRERDPGDHYGRGADRPIVAEAAIKLRYVIKSWYEGGCRRRSLDWLRFGSPGICYSNVKMHLTVDESVTLGLASGSTLSVKSSLATEHELSGAGEAPFWLGHFHRAVRW
jgi:hypothetical protein